MAKLNVKQLLDLQNVDTNKAISIDAKGNVTYTAQ